MSLTNADRLREVHNSFARQNMFEFDSKAAEKDDDVYHFVAFVPFKGTWNCFSVWLATVGWQQSVANSARLYYL